MAQILPRDIQNHLQDNYRGVKVELIDHQCGVRIRVTTRSNPQATDIHRQFVVGWNRPAVRSRDGNLHIINCNYR